MAVAQSRDVPRADSATRIGGRYVVEAALGRGGMGAVFRVRDEANGKLLALKQLTLATDHDEADRVAAQLRFRREFHTMASLKHPRIVEVFDYGVDRDRPYYTMELLDGRDLADLDKITATRACELLRDVASALAFLHTRRLLHRDLAPRNVRCTSDGRAKLIDFGILAATGMSGDVAGTPPLMAPEALHGRPLDHRYDLYGLGALGYRILTGEHAYPARTLEALEATWRGKPSPPSAHAPDIPPALDDLIMSLLAADPMARPSSAAEVIDRLSAIAGLSQPPEVETSQGWIASATLVGRRREVQQIRRAVTRTFEGAGRSLLIEAPSGTGKSRLLREVGLEAQLAGLTVVRADSDSAGRGPYGVLHELAKHLLVAAPEAAGPAAVSRGPMLARVITSLRPRFKPAAPAGDPAEDRMRLQNELTGFFRAVAETHPIALIVDDMQRCDEASAAVLATLAHQAENTRLLIAVALRTDEPARAPAPIASLIDAGLRLKLRGLDEADVGDLCRSLFGDVPHIPRLAQWMHRTAGGSPLYTTELARHLVERGVIRCINGLWSIPEDPGREDLPRSLVEAMDARIRSLPQNARSLAEVLAIHGGELSLDLIVLLADRLAEDDVFAAIDQLGYDEVLIQSGKTWRFRHDGLREALSRGLAEDRRRSLHLRVGEALLASGERGAERDAEVGWHLLRGGDVERGAVLLERAGRALYDAQSFVDCIPPLEAALEVLEAHRGSPRARLEILHMLLMSGAMADRKVALRYSQRCIDGFRFWSGVDVMVKARKLVGRHLAVGFGLFWALMRWIFTPRRGPNPYEAFRTYFVVVGYSATVYSLMFDVPGVERMVAAVDPIAIFKRRVPYAVYLLTCNLLEYPRGNIATVRRNSLQLLDILERDHLTPIREIDRRTGAGGARYLLAMIAVSNVEPTWTHELEELAKIKLRFYDIGAENIRVIYHRLRGEEEAAAEIAARVELMFVQLGGVWQMEAFMPVIASMAYAYTRDTIGLRRTIDEMSRLVDDGFLLGPYLDLARGEYLRERGDLDETRVALEAALSSKLLAMVRLPGLPALAETMLALGDAERARELARDGVALGADPEHGNINGKLRSTRSLALAEAACGNVTVACQLLDDAIVEAKPRGSPLLSGTLHEARARVALLAEDWLAYHEHLAETEYLYRSTRNPVLIAHCARLAQAFTNQLSRSKGASAGESETQAVRHRDIAVVAADAVTTRALAESHSGVSAVLSGCRGAAERAQRALQLVVNEARGTSGYLYLRSDGGFTLAAPSWGDEPPAGLVRSLRQALGGVTGDEAVTSIDVRRDDELLDWKPIVLVMPLAGARLVIGGVAVIGGAMRLVDPPAKLLEEIARGLFDAGDVTYTRTVG